MPLTNKQLSAANELFNRGVNINGHPLSQRQIQIIAELKQRNVDPASSILQHESLGTASPQGLNKEVIAHNKGEPTPLLDRIANNPVVNFLASADIGTQEAVANVVRSIYRDIPTNTTRKWAKAIGDKIASERRAFVAPGASAEAGRLAGGLTAALATAPFAPEALGARGVLPFLGRAATAATAAATQRPEQQVRGAEIGGLIGLGGETVAPALAVAGKAVRRLTTSGLGRPIRNEINKIMTSLRGKVTGDNMNDAVFNSMSKNYEETRGLAKTDNGTRELNNADFIYRNPDLSVHRLYSRAAALGDKNIKKLDKSAWNNALDDQAERSLKELERAPLKQENLEVFDELNRLSRTRLDNFDDATKLRKDINSIASRGAPTIARPGNPELLGIGAPLKKGIDKAILESASEHPETLEALTNANQVFRNEVIPFEKIGDQKSPFLQIYQGKKLNDTLIDSYVKPRQVKRLKLFLDRLPNQKTRNLVAAQKFIPNEKNPKAFIAQYDKLQDEEKRLLFPQHKDRLDILSKINKMAPGAFPGKAEVGAGSLPSLLKAIPATGLGGLAAERLFIGGSPGQAAALLSPLLLKGGVAAASRIPAIREGLFAALTREASQQKQPVSLLRSILPGVAASQISQQIGGQQNG